MIDWKLYGDRFARICNEWDKAEKDIKLAEQVSHKVVFPSIKELRYAGRRIVEALNGLNDDATDDDIQKLLEDAEYDCHRARHDAIDAATAKIAYDIEIAVSKLGYDPILRAFSKFSELRRKLNLVRAKITESRGDRENREAIYSVIEVTDFQEIVDLFAEFQENEPVMKGLAKSQRRRTALSYSIGIASLILAVITLIIA